MKDALTGKRITAGRHLLDGTVRVSLAEALMFPTGLVTAAFLTRWLGPSDYGLLTLTATLVGWIQWSISAMLSRATIISISQSTNWQGIGTAALRLFLVSGIIAAIALWWLSDPISIMLGEPRMAGLLRIFAIDIPLFALVQAHRHILIGTGQYRQRAWSSVGRWLARMLLIIVLVWAGFSVEGAILGSIGATLVELLISRIFVRPRLFGKSDFPAIRLLRFAVPLYVLATCMQLLERMDIFALKILGGTAAQAGIYGAAQNLAIVPVIFSLSFAPLLQATLVRLVRDKQEKEAREMAAESIRLAILLLPFAAMSAGAAAEITRLIFGPEFTASGPILAWLISGTILHVLVSVNTGILIAAGRTRLAVVIVALLVPVAILGFIWLIPRFGSVGASMVTAAAYLAASLSTSMAVRTTWAVGIAPVTLARSLVLGIVAYGAAHWWSTAGIFLIIKLGLISVMIPLVFYFTGELTRRELSFVMASLRGNTKPDPGQDRQ